ncbi:MAG: helix-turn-helix domain-containing protein [Deltaproteobacteria bacterium]|jgi:transcriptional regulator with XRE-family HTH domain|nr:helix-turn-helix domain-containing protein [Deltaproteobacteria bacterium]
MSSDKFVQAFARRVRARMSASGYTQQTLADQMGTSRATVNTLCGGNWLPSLDTLLRLCQALETSPDVLLGMNPAPVRAALPPWVEKILPQLAALDEAGRKAVKGLLDAVASARSTPK